MSTRTQLILDSEAHRLARQRAAELGISLSEYIRRLVAKDLGPQGIPTDISSIFGIGSSGGSDVARHKEEYIAESVTKR